MKILIVDDGDHKVAQLSKRLERIGLSSADITIANNASHAKTLLRAQQFCVAILDLSISNVAGGRLSPGIGIDLMDWMRHTRSGCKMPWKNFFLTALSDDEMAPVRARVADLGVPIIQYKDEVSLTPIVDAISDLWALEGAGALVATSSHCDVALICALNEPEFGALDKVFSGGEDLPCFAGTSALKKVTLQSNDAREIRILLVSVNKMGSVASSFAAAAVCARFRPGVLVLAGITGGIPGKVDIGDIVCSSEIVNFQGGKVKGGVFLPDVLVEHTAMNLYPKLSETRLVEDVVLRAHSELKTSLTRSLTPRFRAGQTGCSDIVVADKEYIGSLRDNYRQMLGVEMEGFGAAYAVNHSDADTRFLMLKSVCDLAGEEKDSRFQEYCSLMSATVARDCIKTGVF